MRYSDILYACITMIMRHGNILYACITMIMRHSNILYACISMHGMIFRNLSILIFPLLFLAFRYMYVIFVV